MRAIVHIGTEKTGTTSIQRYLYQNRKKLKSAGLHFLQSAGKMNNRALPAYFVADNRLDDFYRDEGITTLEAKAEFKKQFLQNFEHELKNLTKSVHTVVISSEHFHSRIRTAEDMDRVHAFLTSYFDDIRIVCYLRDQSSTCASYYSTGLKAGNPATFMEFFQRCTPENYYFNYFDVLSNWERCFGFEALDVSLFSRKTFLNNNLLDDFTAKLDPALIGVLDTEIEFENESLTPVGQALARGLNLALPARTLRPELAPIRERCKTHIYNKFKGTGRQPSLAMQRRIYRDFAASNEQVREKYFPALKLLFEPPAAEPAPVHGIDETLVAELGSLFREIRKLGKDAITAEEYSAIARNFLMGATDVFDGEVITEEPREHGRDTDANKKPKYGFNTVISRDDLRLMLFAASSVEPKNLKLAKDLLTLVREIDPSGPGVNARLEAYKRKEQLAERRRYAITYTNVDVPSDPEEQRKRTAEFGAWLDSLSEHIDGPALNVLKDTQSIRLEGADLIRKPAISSGFMVVQVESEAEAFAMATRCPHLSYGATVFVSEVLQVTP